MSASATTPTRSVRTLTATDGRHAARLAPSPDGSQLAVVLWETPEHDWSARACELALVDAAEDRVVERWRIPSGGVDLAWRGDDGGALVLVGPVRPGGQHGLGLFLGMSEPRLLTGDLAACPIWLAEADAPLVSLAEGLDSSLVRLDGSGNREDQRRAQVVRHRPGGS